MNESFSDVACIVVHHKSPDTLIPTLEALVASGVGRDQIVVVDNSFDSTLAALVHEKSYEIIQVENRGYAAAVNDGLSHLRAADRLREFTLVATHEVLPNLDAVGELRAAALRDRDVAVAGPTLLFGESPDLVWSLGGYLTPWIKLPRHRLSAEAGPADAVDRDWVDGAFTLYRTGELELFGLDELYFLYFEETDLHTRMKRAGKRVVWVPAAVVQQTSSGTPAKLIGRNLFLFHSKLYSKWSGRRAVAVEAARAAAKQLLGRAKPGTVNQILSGWMEAERLVKGRSTRSPYPSERPREQ